MRERIVMIVFVLVLGSAWAAALVAVDTWTAPKIEAHTKAKKRTKVLEALVIGHEGTDVDAVFTENVTTEETGGRTFYRSKEGSVAFEISGAGSQDRITAVMALRSDLETIHGLAIISEKETPGLGSRVLVPENLVNFRGKKLTPRLLIVPAGLAAKENEVDAITGATLTSKAMEIILNAEAEAAVSVLKKGSN